MKLIKTCEDKAKNIRKAVIKMTYAAGKNAAHIGGGLSMPELLSVLYFAVMDINVHNLTDENRDRFILSKGHGAIALYAVLNEKGIVSDGEIKKFKNTGGSLWTHPKKDLNCGIEFSSGSLGQGLSLGAGTALALKRKKNPHHVYVYVGDGECNEGAIWEAAAFSSHHKLNNLTVIIDKNNLQLDAPTKDIIDMGDIATKWRAFGFDVFEVNGHNIADLLEVFKKTSDKPIAIVAHTVKGKGVSFIENNPAWHMGVLNEEKFKLALSEQEDNNV